MAIWQTLMGEYTRRESGHFASGERQPRPKVGHGQRKADPSAVSLERWCKTFR